MASVIKIVAGVGVSLLIYTLFNYTTLPAIFQNFLDWGQREIQIGNLSYQIAPIKFIVVTLLIIMITEDLLIGTTISLFIYLNLATIQAYLKLKVIITNSQTNFSNDSLNLAPPMPLVSSLVQPNSLATQTLDAELNQDPLPQVATAPPGGHQGASPVADALQTLGQGDPSIGHWNPYINR